MITPLMMSHAAKRNFPNDGCTHSFGPSSSASSGVYLYVSLVYGLGAHILKGCSFKLLLHSLSKRKIEAWYMAQGSLGAVVGSGVQQKPSRVTEDTVIHVCIFHDRPCIVPFTVENEDDSQQS